MYNYHRRTLESASDIVGIMGRTSFAAVSSNDIMRRIQPHKVVTLSEQFPGVAAGCLLEGNAPPRLQEVYDASGTGHVSSKRWIYS